MPLPTPGGFVFLLVWKRVLKKTGGCQWPEQWEQFHIGVHLCQRETVVGKKSLWKHRLHFRVWPYKNKDEVNLYLRRRSFCLTQTLWCSWLDCRFAPGTTWVCPIVVAGSKPEGGSYVPLTHLYDRIFQAPFPTLAQGSLFLSCCTFAWLSSCQSWCGPLWEQSGFRIAVLFVKGV